MVVYTDLGTRTLLIEESWRKSLIIMNERRNSTREIPFISVTPYKLKSSTSVCFFVIICRNEITAPPLLDWKYKAGGIFGLGLAGSKISTGSLAQYLQISAYGFSLRDGDPHLNLDHYESKYSIYF